MVGLLQSPMFIEKHLLYTYDPEGVELNTVGLLIKRMD